MSQYQKLLEELSGMTMAKALPADDGNGDQKIQAAAEGGGDGDANVKKDGEGEGDQPMAKSFEVTLADGTKVEAEDGTALVKSLVARIDTNESDTAKVMEVTVGLLKSANAAIAEQGTLIKSLQDKVAALSNEGKGRKTILSVIDKTGPTEMTKSEPTGMQPTEFLAKSEAAWSANRITGQEFNTIDVSLRTGQPIDQGLIARVMA